MLQQTAGHDGFPRCVAHSTPPLLSYFVRLEDGILSQERTVLIEGLSPDQILALSPEHLDALVLCGEPLVLRVGTAEVLGKFRATSSVLIVELAHIDGGGEGVLPALASLAAFYAHARGYRHWNGVSMRFIAQPNPEVAASAGEARLPSEGRSRIG